MGTIVDTSKNSGLYNFVFIKQEQSTLPINLSNIVYIPSD